MSDETSTNGTKTPGKKITWKRGFEELLSLVGANAGLSDYWRFPYLVLRNGGGAFLIPFFTVLVICGIPTFFLELATSQYCGEGMIKLWNICPLFKGMGIILFMVNFFYMSVITTFRLWLLVYFVNSFTSDLPWTSCSNSWNTEICQPTLGNVSQRHIYNDPNNTLQSTSTRSSEEEFWQFEVLKISSGLTDIGSFRWTFVLYSLGYRILVILLILKGIQSIAKVMYITTILPQVLILAMFIQSLILPGAADGILFLITPDFSRLTDMKIWIEATFMVFYTLGPGWGGIMLMGSHAKFKSNCLRTTITCSIADISIAIFNCLVLFSVIGVMASDIGKPVAEVVYSGMSVGLVGYTRAMSYLPGSYIWSVLFFLAILLTTLDSQMVYLEAMVTFTEEWYNKLWSRKKRVIITATISLFIFLLNLPYCTQAGPYMFQLYDWYAPTWPMIVVVVLEVVIIMWIYGGDRFDEGIQCMLGKKTPHIVRVCLAFVCPLMFFMLLVVSFHSYKPPTYGTYRYPGYATAIGWSLAVTVLLPIPLYMIVSVYREKGSLNERIRKLCRPHISWGPNDSTYKTQYLKFLERKRTFWDVAYYNLTGRHRDVQNDEHYSEAEQLDVIKSCD